MAAGSAKASEGEREGERDEDSISYLGRFVVRNVQYSSVSVLFVFSCYERRQIKVPFVIDVAMCVL